MDEVWKDINGYENLYQISNKGEIRSVINKNYGIVARFKSPYRPYMLCVKLNNHVGVSKTHAVHVLVAEHFVNNPDTYKRIRHLNKNVFDNDSTNLEWYK